LNLPDQGHVYLFGEVLFDHFPDGSRVLGGAPFNVAWHLQAFGLAPRLISRVGSDAEGESVLAAMRNWGMDTSCMQIDPRRPTGRVEVSFADGEPSYDIVAECAYDAIEPLSLVQCKLLYHGSLAARSAISAATLLSLRQELDGSVFIDVNLRPPWWQSDTVESFLAGADWVKLNQDELALLGGEEANSGDAFIRRLDLTGLLVTRGARGAELLRASCEPLSVAPGPDTKLVDTVGAGDAFTAVLLLGLCCNWPLPLTLRRAQDFAAAVVGRRGATIAEADFYRAFSQQWQAVN
jgi:fructokinase